MPITPFIGVRISWLILAKNSLFALLADYLNLVSDYRLHGVSQTAGSPAIQGYVEGFFDTAAQWSVIRG